MASLLEQLQTRLAGGEAVMLVHVAEIRGSAPRDAGARMLVGENDLFATIGGGELEYRAIEKARVLLAANAAGWVDWSLGPELGQCCGGRVVLAFEPFAPADLSFVETLVKSESSGSIWTRNLNIGPGAAMVRHPAVEKVVYSDSKAAIPGQTINQSGETLELNIPLGDTRTPLWLFGAGHVGRAVVAALAPLDFAITWIDGRAGQFPDDVPTDIRCLELAMPELIVDEARPGTWFLVMTHSHPLDEEICAAVLADGRFGYLGLIGSGTKRALFESRLKKRGLTPPDLARLHCPIGLAGITDKRPAAIAASVAADLLIRQNIAQSVDVKSKETRSPETQNDR